MKAWKEFYDYLLPLVPGCPQPMANLQLRLAAQEWCEKTLCWREWLDDTTTNGVDTSCEFTNGNDQAVVQLLRATLAGQHLDVITADNLPANWRTTSAVCARGVFTLDRSTFNVVPLQAAGLIVQTEVALKPSNTATGVTDEVFRQYVNEIALGAAGKLQLIPKKPYSNPASMAYAQFQDAINRAATDVSHAYSRAPLRVRASFI